MKYILVLILFIGCNQAETPQKYYYGNGKLNYVKKNINDTMEISFFAGGNKSLLDLKFYKDHIVDTIIYRKDKNFPYYQYIVIDSLKGQYFYGTEYILYSNKMIKSKSVYRYKRNKNFITVFTTPQPYGVQIDYDQNGNITRKLNAKVVNDSTYYELDEKN